MTSAYHENPEYRKLYWYCKHVSSWPLNRPKICLIYLTSLLLSFIVIIIIYNYKFVAVTVPPFKSELNDTTCYTFKDQLIKLKADENLNASEKSIFFLETSCRGGLSIRQACAVESASKANSDWKIFVLVTGPLHNNYKYNETYNIISAMKNVLFARINITEFIKGTPIESLYLKDAFDESDFPVVHHSDVLRILTLNRYGGVYLDLDVIVMKSFNDLPANFIIKQDDETLANGILRFSKQGIGKLFTNLALKDINYTFDPKSWCGNGPGLIGRAMDILCNIFADSSAETCQGIKVFNKKYFLPIVFQEMRKYFQDHDIEPTAAYTHHIWNALSSNIAIDSRSLFAKLARKYCPNIYKVYGKNLRSW